jgi:hypothetical protein
VLTRLFLAADTNAAICGTRWAGYQTITEHLDHAAPAHGKTADDKAVNRDLTSPAVAPHHKRPLPDLPLPDGQRRPSHKPFVSHEFRNQIPAIGSLCGRSAGYPYPSISSGLTGVAELRKMDPYGGRRRG